MPDREERKLAWFAVSVTLGLFLAAAGPGAAQEGVAPAGTAPAGADSLTATTVDSLAAVPAVPAGPESTRVYQMEEVLVTGTRLPSARSLYFSNVSVATSDDIREISSSTAAEALVTDSGVGVSHLGPYGSLETLSLRGGNSNEVVYLLDGVPLSDPQISSIDLNWLPLGGTLRLEAMKGGASSLYGSGAIGGVVNLVSLDAAPAIPSSEFSAWTGDFGSQEVSAMMRRALGGGLGILGAYDFLKSDGWTANSAYEGNNYYGKVIYSGYLGLDAVVFRHTGAIESPGDYPGKQNDQRDFMKFSARRRGALEYGGTYYHTSTDQTFVAEATVCNPFSSTYVHRGGMDGVQIEVTRRSDARAAAYLSAGYERRHIDSRSLTYPDLGAGKRSQSDGYVSGQYEVSRTSWRLSGSLRGEHNSQFAFEVSPQATAWLMPGHGITLFGKLDRSFAYPSFNDLYWLGPNQAGDPNLKTEHSNDAEVGVMLERGPLELAGTAYYRHVDDMIIWRADQTCAFIKSTNAEATLKGFELALTGRAGSALEGAISYWVGRETDETGRQLEYRPVNLFSWRLKAQAGLTSHISCGAVFAGRRVPEVDAGNQSSIGADCSYNCVSDARLPGYVSAVLYGYLGIDRGRAFLRINNLFNHRIVPSWGMPDFPLRYYEAGIEVNLRD